MLQRSVLRQSRSILRSSTSSSRYGVSRLRTSPLQGTPTPPRLWLKSYSTATESTDKASTEPPPSQSAPPKDTPAQGSKVEDAQKKELETKDKEIIDLKDKYLRSVADFRNLQERTKRDIDTARNFAISRFTADLIESIDNLDRALTTVPADKVNKDDSNKDLENLYSGLKMTESVLMQTLKKHGLERFDPSENEEPFNPNLHDATFQTKMEGKKDGTVFQTIQKGFMLNGRVLRAAKVGVVKNS